MDEQQDSIGRKSPYFLGLKHVADLTRTLYFRPRSRVTKAREASVTEQNLIDVALPFFDALAEGFPTCPR